MFSEYSNCFAFSGCQGEYLNCNRCTMEHSISSFQPWRGVQWMLLGWSKKSDWFVDGQMLRKVWWWTALMDEASLKATRAFTGSQCNLARKGVVSIASYMTWPYLLILATTHASVFWTHCNFAKDTTYIVKRAGPWNKPAVRQYPTMISLIDILHAKDGRGGSIEWSRL